MSDKKEYDNPGPFMKRVQQMLKDDPRSFPEIYNETGISFYWLRKFASGEYKNPSVNRVEHLYTVLTGKALEV